MTRNESAKETSFPGEQSGKLPSIHTDRESIDRVSHSLTANQLLLPSIRAASEHLLLLLSPQTHYLCVCKELRDFLLELVVAAYRPVCSHT